MSSSSPFLSLPYIQGGQAQKHVTHNEALQTLDAVVQLSVRALATAPDGDAQDGDRYAVASPATGDFVGKEGAVAIRENGAWVFLTPNIGWVAFNAETEIQIVSDGTSWNALSDTPSQVDQFGIATSADAFNRFSVSSPATLFSHDGSGHQLKVNKSQATDTASVLFQTGFGARAEMGTMGSDAFEIRVSPDGASFYTALRIDGTSGAVDLPQTTNSATKADLNARQSGLVGNSTGALGAENYPSSLTFDQSQSPNHNGTFRYQGYDNGWEEMEESISIDPNRAYRLGVYLRQEAVAGDWSGFPQADRHAHHVGLNFYDADGLMIQSFHHMRHYEAGQDSLTVLSQPLSPGDTVMHVADAAGWNNSNPDVNRCGLIIFGYRSSAGQTHEHYSRIEAPDLFENSGVNKATNQIALKAPLPGSLGNPDDPSGTWPAGTAIANRSYDWDHKFSFCADYVPGATDTWYHISNAIGGLDRSGTNDPRNFPPGTVTVKPMMLLNYTNRAGGFSGFPDTGPNQSVWIGGISITLDATAIVEPSAEGSSALYVLKGDTGTGGVSLVLAAETSTEV